MNIRANPWANASRTGLIALLMAAPLAFGAVQPWAWGAMTVGVACLLLFWAMGCARAGAVTLAWSPLYIPGLALLALAAVQLRFGLTMDRIATREAILKLATYIAIFLLTQQLFQAPSSRLRFARAVTVYAFLISVFAILQFFASPGLLYGIIQPRWAGYVFGPYVNHNHYAGLMELLIPITVAYVLARTADAGGAGTYPQLTTHGSSPGRKSRFEADSELLPATRNSQLAVLPALFAILIAIVSVFLSGSRGGTIALAAEFALLVAVLMRAGAGNRAGGELNPRSRMANPKFLLATGLVLIALSGAFFSWLDPGDVWKRWQDAAHTPELEAEDRVRMTADSMRMSREHLGDGVGIGAFETAYPKYQTVVTDLLIDYAHNDYAQLLAEAGMLAWVLLPTSIASFLWLAFRGLRSRLAHPTGWLQSGAALGVCGILVHSFSDFNLHIPANAAWFSAVAGLAVAPAALNPTQPGDAGRVHATRTGAD